MPKKITQKLILFLLITFSLIKSTYSVCNQLNCPPLRGICSRDICICDDNYKTINNKNIQSNGIFCNYPLKSRFVAFVLEFFFPFGVGHFYSGKTILAAIKLGFFVLLISLCCFVLCCVNAKAVNGCAFFICIVLILCIISLVIMEFIDLICYGIGFYVDGNGVEMK